MNAVVVFAFAFAFVALVSGNHVGSNYEAELLGQTPYRRLLRNTRIINDEERCEPGATKKEDCNNCFCIADGTGWACGRMLCLPDSFDRVKRALGTSFTCVPNETFMDDCNECFCLSDGHTAGCTAMACPPKETTSTLSPAVVA